MKKILLQWRVNVFATLILLICGCRPDQPLTNAYVVGVYKGHYFNGEELVVLRPDGTFIQEFKTNGILVYSNHGNWELSPPNSMDLSPFTSWKPSKDKPETFQVMNAVYRENPDRIEFGEWPYSAVRDSTNISNMGPANNKSQRSGL